ncbi:helix-turn-helix domain-containing protein [Levilactobacillus brevis]|uniref:helix-turn-helix domain-containing protein n=2 Tax=Levilactobacillus brevis TaxID=1580 RepID=UPI001C01E870|nr:helix-turn-helix transcriptional regulator [Levilactobacillus brevis]MBT9676765.1 helix-turn-helix domain-containing protein [Levilactobacillus brevis]
MELAEIIGENLRVLMAIRKMRVGELSTKSGISRNTITTLRKGKFKMIQTKSLQKLADCLNVTVAQLVTPFKEEK